MLTRCRRSIAIAAFALLPAVAGAAEPFDFGSSSAVTKASDLVGRLVETRDGKELGQVKDFAVDLATGRVAYVVVSVGSFLIQDSLIAVAPDALRQSADADGRLVLEADAETLRKARRFSAGDWPAKADVVAAAGEAERAGESAAAGAGEGEEAAPPRGSATISSANKTATLSAGERSIHIEEHPQPAADAGAAQTAARPTPTTRFGRLDTDGNGVLDRAEIAHELSRHDKYSDIDLDGNGTIDEGEFEAFMAKRAAGPGGQAPDADGGAATGEAPAP